MDPRDRADALLARARARGGVVTPENATSPMDSLKTVQIPRAAVTGADRRHDDPDATMILPPGAVIGHRGGQQPPQYPQPGQPQHPQQQPPQPQQPQPPHHQPPQQQPQQHQPQQQSQPSQERQLPGLVPTVQHAPVRRQSLAERLNGELREPGEQRDQRDQRR